MHAFFNEFFVASRDSSENIWQLAHISRVELIDFADKERIDPSGFKLRVTLDLLNYEINFDSRTLIMLTNECKYNCLK